MTTLEDRKDTTDDEDRLYAALDRVDEAVSWLIIARSEIGDVEDLNADQIAEAKRELHVRRMDVIKALDALMTETCRHAYVPTDVMADGTDPRRQP